MSSLRSILSSSDESGEDVGRIAGLGSILGILAAVLGLIFGKTLVPIAGLDWVILQNNPFQWIVGGDWYYYIISSVFMGLIAVSLLLQAIGSRNLGETIGTSYHRVLWVGVVTAAATAIYLPMEFPGVYDRQLIPDFVVPMFFLGTFFVMAWQLIAVIYTDTSKTLLGFLAGIFNASFIPLLAIGHVINPIITYVAYIVLLIGQFMTLLFWWSPIDTLREYARSTDTAKVAFTLSGVLTFVFGFAAVFFGPIGSEQGVEVWQPWSTLVNETTYLTSPALVFGFLAMMLYWIMLSPRLGARELKAAAIGEDIIKGGNKWFMLFLTLVGLLAAGQAGARIEDVGTWGYFMVVAPAGVMFIMGASYTAKTDLVTGIPLVIAAVFLMVHPYVMLPIILIPWILILLTQIFLVIESIWRGLTGFSQASLTVIVSLATSIAIIIFMLGGFGSGPLALWPTNRWFNITLIPRIPAAVQGPAIIILPILALMIRNVSLAGYAYGRGYTSGGVLMGMSVLFAFMIPAIAGNQSVAHEANTGAALLLALYAISVVLVLSLNLNLANDVEEKGHGFEGTFIKISTLAGLVAAAVVLILMMIVFAGIPSPEEIALTVSIMVAFVVGTEILSSLGWLISGIRLGMLRGSFRFTRLE
ncbi:MAG: hypothetical protein PVJ05_11110 [Candidatus Thorarchaeota archaeon]|jgi:hypothetical protein